MASFDEHIRRTLKPDGTHDAAAAEESRYQELVSSPGTLDDLARQAAQHERSRWESSNREHLRAQFKQPTLDGLDLEAMVPLGDATFVPLGDMNDERIRLRKDLRTKAHLRENDAYAKEMEFWFHVETMLPPSGGTIRDIS